MRIVKGTAVAALNEECRRLSQQRLICQRQISKLTAFGLEGMSGKSVTALEQKARMQAAVVRTHLRFYGDLIQANRRNIQLVRELPVTSPGIIDTREAYERMSRAETLMRAYENQRDRKVSEIWRINQSASKVPSTRPDEARGIATLSAAAVQNQYRSLINGQKEIVSANQEIIDRCEQYDRESAQLYLSIDTSYLSKAADGASAYLKSGTWGNTAWVGEMGLEHDVATQSAEGTEESPLETLISGGVKMSGSVGAAYELEDESLNPHSDLVPDDVEQDFLTYAFKVKPYGFGGTEPNEITDEDGTGTGAYEREKYGRVGIEAKGELHALNYKHTDKDGILQHSVGVSIGNAAVSGKVGASLYKNGVFDPKLEAKVEASASFASAELSGQMGDDDYNLHAKAQGELFGANAKAGFSYSKEEGLQTSVGAEAYLAKGEISGGITIMGIRFDATIEGKAGAIGGKVGGQLSGTSAETEFALGALLGVGIKTKVDWSGFSPPWDIHISSIEDWWKTGRFEFSFKL